MGIVFLIDPSQWDTKTKKAMAIGFYVAIVLLLIFLVAFTIIEVHNSKLEKEMKVYAHNNFGEDYISNWVYNSYWIECNGSKAYVCDNYDGYTTIDKYHSFPGIVSHQDKIDGYNELGKQLWFKHFNGIKKV